MLNRRVGVSHTIYLKLLLTQPQASVDVNKRACLKLSSLNVDSSIQVPLDVTFLLSCLALFL